LTAQKLRRDMNQTEWRVWDRIRARQVAGWKFRRQHPLGPYFVDFYCPAARLVVEIDGPTHGEERQWAYDDRRTEWLKQQGYEVLRFWTADVDESLDDVVATISVARRTAPSGASRHLPRERGSHLFEYPALRAGFPASGEVT
jgi:very-short-patch-repair endonuclease